MLTYDKIPGNAGCTICGLRASSKNVVIRNVFTIWPNEKTECLCQVHENYIAVVLDVKYGEQTIPMVGIRPTVKHRDTGETPDLGTIIMQMIDIGLSGAEIRAVLCDHRWVQDPGTNTV